MSKVVLAADPAGAVLSSDPEDKLPFLRPGENTEAPKSQNEYVILMDGNSITRHDVSPQIIEKYGWDRLCGMAASSEENDYAHLLAAKIQKQLPEKKVRLIFGSPEKQTVMPDLVVVQGGEHVGSKELSAYDETYTKKMQNIRSLFPKSKIIAIGIWNPICREEFKECTGENYFANAVRIEKIQSKVAAELGIPFASVSKYENDPANTGDGKVAAVRWHPNDNGMKCYAEEAFKAFLQL